MTSDKDFNFWRETAYSQIRFFLPRSNDLFTILADLPTSKAFPDLSISRSSSLLKALFTLRFLLSSGYNLEASVIVIFQKVNSSKLPLARLPLQEYFLGFENSNDYTTACINLEVLFRSLCKTRMCRFLYVEEDDPYLGRDFERIVLEVMIAREELETNKKNDSMSARSSSS